MNKCPFCEKEGKKSKLYSGGAMQTLMGGSESFYDEDGKKHYHEINTTTRDYHCSNGHYFTRKYKQKCPSCDYNEGKEQIQQFEKPKGQWTAR